MFYIIELLSNDLQELFDFVIDILSQHTTISNIREKNGRWSASTQYFRLSIYYDDDRKMFDKEDFDVNINTVLWFDVLQVSGYSQIIISLLKSIIKKYTSDIIVFNTGYDALLVRKEDEITLGESYIPLVKDIESKIMEDTSK
ncbi:MAG: hypothetical protein Q4C64_07695 [Erysipelotrichia bacterium]|nr:hypothetical protein [Erysipelotrichia bacterium]